MMSTIKEFLSFDTVDGSNIQIAEFHANMVCVEFDCLHAREGIFGKPAKQS
jgi:hypothetical protein